MGLILKNTKLKNASTFSFDMPTWSFEFIPDNSSISPYYESALGYEGLATTKLNDSGTIGIPAYPLSSTLGNYLRPNLIGSYPGIEMPTAQNNRGFLCSSLNSYNFLHDGTGGTLFLVIKPYLSAFLGVFGNTRTAAYSQIGFSVAIDNAPRELRVTIQNGNGVTNCARVDYSVPAIDSLLIIAITIDTDLKLWVNGTYVGSDPLSSPSAADASGNLYIFSEPLINGMRGYGDIIQGINTVLNTDFIEKYSNFLYNGRS